MSVGRVGVGQSAEESAVEPVAGVSHRARAADAPLALIPALLTVILSFRAGGYFPGATAVAAVAVAVVLAVRAVVSRRPFAGLSRSYLAGAVLLALLALWTLLSGTWSHAPARAAIEHDRVLLYALLFVLMGAWGRTDEGLRWIVRGVAAAAFVVCLCGLVTRLLPDVWELAPAIADERLSYPLTYWNSLGLLAALGLVLAFALTADEREHPVGRVLAAAALPVLATTMLLTYSRGAVLAAVVGLVALVVAGRPRALANGLLAAAPAIALAALAAYAADLLATEHPTTAAAAAQGHRVAVVVVIATLLAAAVRRRLLQVPSWWPSRSLPAVLRGNRRAWIAGLALAVAVAIAGALSGAVGDQYDRLVDAEPAAVAGADSRARLTTSRDNGRLLYWRVALKEFSQQPLTGEGAGTFPLQWDRLGRASQFNDAHSLYVETLGELGLVGFLLVVAIVLLVLAGFLARARGRDRVVGAALFGAGLAWALHAGVDWDWEMPAITLWFFAAGGLALARRRGDGTAGARRRATSPALRVAIGVACVLLVFVPARVRLSDGPLRESAQAFARGDCATALDRARDSTAVWAARPEPHLIIGYCDIRAGRRADALRAMRAAVRREPQNWETYYGLALAGASAEIDPRPTVRFARRLNPWEPLPAQALRLFDSEDPALWRSRAPAARLPGD